MFELTVKCFTTRLRAKEPDMYFNFFLGDGDLQEVKFQEFEVWPICATPE